MPTVKIGGVDIEPAHAKPQRVSMLLWGVSGAGKTTLACTAPGRKLLVNFDPDGASSVAYRTDVDVADLSDVSHGVVEQFKSQENPLGIGKVLDEYDTIIIDSLTNAQHMSVMHAVTKVTGATIERPSMQGYGHRNALLTQLVKNVLRITARANKHAVFIAHEAAPHLNDNGVVISITMSLGGQLTTNAPIDFSEVWAVEDTGKARRIAIRPVRARRPCKTRLFVTNGDPEFEWRHTGHEVEDWYNAWRDNGWKKIALPKSPVRVEKPATTEPKK